MKDTYKTRTVHILTVPHLWKLADLLHRSSLSVRFYMLLHTGDPWGLAMVRNCQDPCCRKTLGTRKMYVKVLLTISTVLHLPFHCHLQMYHYFALASDCIHTELVKQKIKHSSSRKKENTVLPVASV